MTLEEAINLNETNDYIIYTMNSVTTGQYGVVVPKNITGTLNMLIDLNMKSTFDEVGNGTKTKDQLVSEIAWEYNKLRARYNAGMLVMPMMDSTLFSNIVNNGDKQKMFDEVKKIGAITSELYKNLTDSGIDKQRIDQKIVIIEKKDEDIKFVNWLKEQMPNFVDGILYSELNGTNVSGGATTVFASNNNIFESASQESAPKVEEQVTPVTPISGGIFDNIPPVASNVVPTDNGVAPVSTGTVVTEESAMPVTSTPTVEPVAVPTPVESVSVGEQLDFGSIFETNSTTTAPVPPVVETSVPPVVETPINSVEPLTVETPVNQPVASNDIFNTNNNGAPVPPTVEAATAPVVETPVSQVATAPVVETPVSQVETPVANQVNNDVFGAPVQSVSVQATVPVNNIPSEVVVENSSVDGPKPVESASLDSTMTFTSVAEQNENMDEPSTEEGDENGNKSKGFVNLAILLVVIVAITFISIEIGKYLYNVYGA